jgi:hypothetical protein
VAVSGWGNRSRGVGAGGRACHGFKGRLQRTPEFASFQPLNLKNFDLQRTPEFGRGVSVERAVFLRRDRPSCGRWAASV